MMEEEGIEISGKMMNELYGVFDTLFDDIVREHADEIMENALAAYANNVISDERKKRVKKLRSAGGPLSNDDILFLMDMAGPSSDGMDAGSIFDDDGGVTEEMLDGYAEHLRNYLYNYKEEAQSLDPSIDPNEEHAGPMAQDIEKVAPDCVKETPDGIKTVDGNRLALVNAGVIGELARKVKELEDRING